MIIFLRVNHTFHVEGLGFGNMFSGFARLLDFKQCLVFCLIMDYGLLINDYLGFG